jgi:galactose-1-phosphate uridylyltransferase
LDASRQYYNQNGTNFWSDFIVKEKELGERYIGTIGSVLWFTSFASRGWLADIRAIFDGSDSILNLSQQDFAHLSQVLVKVFNYIKDQNLYSFNLAIYSGIRGEDYFWTQARIVPRLFFPPLNSSDVGSLGILHGQFFNMLPPEVACQDLRRYFQDG